MKALWVMLGAFASLGILCSGANCLFGYKLFNKGGARVAVDAQTYALETVRTITTGWDIKELQSRAALGYQPLANSPQAVQFFTIAKAKLGALKSLPQFTKVVPDEDAGTEDGVYKRISFAGDATFQKAAASVEVTLAKNGDKWEIVNFQVKTPLFKRL